MIMGKEMFSSVQRNQPQSNQGTSETGNVVYQKKMKGVMMFAMECFTGVIHTPSHLMVHVVVCIY